MPHAGKHILTFGAIVCRVVVSIDDALAPVRGSADLEAQRIKARLQDADDILARIEIEKYRRVLDRWLPGRRQDDIQGLVERVFDGIANRFGSTSPYVEDALDLVADLLNARSDDLRSRWKARAARRSSAA